MTKTLKAEITTTTRVTYDLGGGILVDVADDRCDSLKMNVIVAGGNCATVYLTVEQAALLRDTLDVALSQLKIWKRS